MAKVVQVLIFTIMAVLIQVALIFGAIQAGFADREHKVHNIVLYPERNSWCQTTPIKQIVASTGYESTTIDNNVCVGACFSYSIPRTQPAEPGEIIGPYCDSCQPSETMCYHVTLRSDDKSEQPRTIKKRVEIITNCSCMSCEKGQNKDCDITDQNTSELPTDLFAMLHPNNTVQQSHQQPQQQQQPQSPPEIPELLALGGRNHRNRSDANATTVAERNSKLVNLLKSIQEESAEDEGDSNFAYDAHELDAILETIEKYESELNTTDLMELVSFVNVENSDGLHMDLTRLKEVVYEFRKKKELSERHRAFGLGGGSAGDVQKYGLSKSFVVDRNRIDGGGSHRQGHHYLGEKQQVGLGSGHLAIGPHGSLVLAPDSKIQRKIDIDSDMLTPNHEGLVISYENHPDTNLDD